MRLSAITGGILCLLILLGPAAQAALLKGRASGEVGFHYTERGYAAADVELVWSPLTADFATDKVLVLAIEAPPGKAFAVDTPGSFAADMDFGLYTYDANLGPSYFGPGSVKFDMIKGDEPRPGTLHLMEYHAGTETISCYASAVIPAASRLVFARIEITYTVPAACDLAFVDQAVYASELRFYAQPAAAPGAWVYFVDQQIATDRRVWGAVKALYR